MIMIVKLNRSSRFRDRTVASTLRKNRGQQSVAVTSCMLLASLLISSASQSAAGPQVGKDAHGQASRDIFFSELRTEEKTWWAWGTFERSKVLFGSRTVIVDNDRKTLDNYAFDKVYVVGDSHSKLITRGGTNHEPLVMQDNDLRGEIIVESGALQVTDDSIAAKLITVKKGAWLIGNGSATPQWGIGRQRDHHVLIERGGSLQVGAPESWHKKQFNDLIMKTAGASGSFVLKGNLTNRGDFFVHDLRKGPGIKFYIQGDYHGEQDSVVHMAIGDRADLLARVQERFGPEYYEMHKIIHDELVIMGNSSGESRVNIVNLGGGTAVDYARGSIKLITVAGDSKATFTLARRAVAGSYDYRLIRGDNRYTPSKNWYLVSDASALSKPREAPEEQIEQELLGSPGNSSGPLSTAPPSVTEGKDVNQAESQQGISPTDGRNVTANAGDPSRPEPDTTHEDPFTIETPWAPRTKIIRPEAGSYNSNALAANTMFQMNLNDRLSSYYQGEGHGHHGSAWVRYNGSRNHLNDASGQLRIRGDKNIVTLGVDMLASSTDLVNQITIGVMGGYGHYRGHTVSRVSGYSSRGRVDGHSVGIYGTYQQNADTQSGIYLDSWVLWNRFNNKVKGDDLPNERYTSKGMTASAELGYNALIAERDSVKYVLQPHAQIIYQNVRSDSLHEANGTRIEFQNRGRTQTVLGFRAAAHVPSGLTSTITPHLEVNWLRSSKNYAVRMNGVGAEMDGGRDTGQLKLGLEGDINQRVALDVALFRNQGKSGYHETGGNLALKYRF